MKGLLNKVNSIETELGITQPAKSVTKANVAERFEGDTRGGAGEKEQLHIQGDHGTIVKALDGLAFPKDDNGNDLPVNMKFAKAIQTYEASHQMTSEVKKAIENELGAEIVL